jgi:signal transduction histidine kinase
VNPAHAPRAWWRFRSAPRHLDSAVTDTGRGPAADTTGHGLIGMRERAALYHGQLEMFIPSDGGFGVHVRLEVDGG